jgi:hypothetical protein
MKRALLFSLIFLMLAWAISPAWAGSATFVPDTIRDLSDIDSTAPSSGEGLIYNAVSGKYEPKGVVQSALSDIVSVILDAAPRHVFWVYGDSTDGGTTPDATTQASIDALIAAGVPEANIRWLYIQDGNTFSIADLASGTTFDGITLTLSHGVFAIDGMASPTTFDNVVITEQGNPEFVVADLTSISSFDGVTLVLAGGTLSVNDAALSTTLGNITLTLAGGPFTVADMSSGSTFDNVTITEQSAPVAVSDTFDGTGALGADWATVTGYTAPSRQTGQAKGNASLGISAAYWSTETFADNQYSEAYVDNGSYQDGVMVRCSSSAATYYVLMLDHDYNELGLYKYISGSYNYLGGWSYPGDPRYLRLEVSGTTLTAKYKTNPGDNWTTAGTKVDSSIASGKPGIFFYNTGGRIDDWAGGDL